MNRITLAALIFALTISAHAEITTVRHFRLGEADAGAAPGSAAGASSLDSTATQNLTVTGAPLYSADVANANSTLCMEFDGSTQYATTGNWNNLTTHFGVEAWVKPAAPDGEHYIIYNGQSATNGWGILQNPFTGKFGALFGGRATFGEGEAVPGVWTHLAIVCTDAVATFYVNGVPSGTTTDLPNPASGFIGIGTNAVASGHNLFEGKIDEVRVFTFAPGAFVPVDLLFNVVPLPILNLTRVDTTDTLSWPTADRGFGLETTTDLLSNTWTPVYRPDKLGGTFSITRTSTDPARFYRLKKPCGVIAPPMLPQGKFINLLNDYETRNVPNPSAQVENAILGNTPARLDASAFIDPADCNGGADSMNFHWAITYPVVPPAVPTVYAVQGITGYGKPVLDILPDAMVNQPVPYTPNGLGVQIRLTVTSRITGLSTVVDMRSQVVASALTLTIYNDCKNRVIACPSGCGVCTIAAALPTSEPH